MTEPCHKVVIREAIQELKKWAQETLFTLTEHECDGGRPGTNLIREWKDVLTQVGDNQALLQSLKVRFRVRPSG